jgi:hypothetical protein
MRLFYYSERMIKMGANKNEKQIFIRKFSLYNFVLMLHIWTSENKFEAANFENLLNAFSGYLFFYLPNLTVKLLPLVILF